MRKLRPIDLNWMRSALSKVTCEHVTWGAGSETHVSTSWLRGWEPHPPYDTSGSVWSLALWGQESVFPNSGRSGICQSFGGDWLEPPREGGVFPQRWGRVAGGGLFQGPLPGPGISGPPKTAEYSYTAILSSLMTSVFALDQKVKPPSPISPRASLATPLA